MRARPFSALRTILESYYAPSPRDPRSNSKLHPTYLPHRTARRIPWRVFTTWRASSPVESAAHKSGRDFNLPLSLFLRSHPTVAHYRDLAPRRIGLASFCSLPLLTTLYRYSNPLVDALVSPTWIALVKFSEILLYNIYSCMVWSWMLQHFSYFCGLHK